MSILVEAGMFIEPYTIEKSGHVGSLWTTDDRVSHAECCGWSEDYDDAEKALNGWRAHVAEAMASTSSGTGAAGAPSATTEREA